MSTVAMSSHRRSAAGPASVADRPAGALRLARRGRLVVFLACLMAVGALAIAFAGAAIGGREAGDPVPVRVVTVQPGDTLWGIASRVAPGEDPREVIEEIRDLNALSSSIQSGDELAVPIGP